MLYTVSEAAKLLNVSKVTVYNKLKIEEYAEKVTKKGGKTYISDDLLKLIRQNLKANNTADNIGEPNHATTQEDIDNAPKSKEDLSETVNLNKALLDTLLHQLDEKDQQIKALHKLIENNQVLLREKQNTLFLEERCKELDNKLIEVRENMNIRKEQQQNRGFFNWLFGKKD